MPEKLEDIYPSVSLAYDVAVNSYDVAIKRIDSIDGRIQTFLTLAVSTTAIVVSVTVGKGFAFRSWWLYLAIAALICAFGVGTYARIAGTICLLEPKKFYERWLHKSGWAFRKDLVYFAGEDFDESMGLVRKKWRLSLLAILFFALEAVFLAVWAAVHHP